MGEFVTMLNEMRLGMLSQQSIMKFKALARTPEFDDNIEPTELFPRRFEVDSANNARMRSLPGDIHQFQAEEGGAVTNPQMRDKLLQNCMAPKILELKMHAQVMLIKNMDENLVNGSLGKVIGFMSEITYSLCEREGIDVESAMNLDAGASAATDDPYGFPTLDKEDSDSESVARKKRKILMLRTMAAETTQIWPLVRFTTASGLHIDRLVTREKWSIEAPDGEVQAYRRQIPLILAYAISIHKAQGQTLSRVKVDLGKVFEKGQAYVALSRATSREGLQILRFDVTKVMAHPKVTGFYRSLEGVDRVIKKEADAVKGWDTRALEKLMEREEEDHGLLHSYACC
jgi:ATP-dependent DNA helicase PIF1